MVAKNTADKVHVDEVLAAVVVADSFNTRFMPLTVDTPRCLVPLANMPLLEYSLEFLATAGVQEIYVVCCAHHRQIKAYLKSSRWYKSTSPKVVTVVSQQLKSTGDALRDLDAKQLLKSDFILISGDVVSNMDLGKALEEHRARRLADKNAIMTMVVKTASPTHRTRAKGEEGIFVLDASTRECVQYRASFPRKQKLKLDLDLFKSHTELQVRNDLIDCQIDICSVDVPALFTENFDYQDIRKHFVRGILESDILGKQIHCHIISDTYAARVRSTQMYDSISKDIMARWTYPMVPETNTLSTSYKLSHPYIYKEQGVILQYTTKLKHHVIVGDGTNIGENTKVTNSVIGRNCKIGSNVVIDGAYIWDGCEIGDNCLIERSILAANVKILSDVVIEKGCLIGSGVHVGPDFKLSEFSRLTLKEVNADEDSADETDDDSEDGQGDKKKAIKEYSKLVVGAQGKGYLWEEIGSDEDDDDEHGDLLNVCSIARDVQLHGIEDVVEEDSDVEDDASDIDPLERSHREIVSTIERALEENHTIENLALELNTLKFAENLDFHDIRLMALPTILSRLVTDAATLSAAMKRWGGLLAKFATDSEDQLDLIEILVNFCVEHEEAYEKLFVKVLQRLYELDIVEEDVILSWWYKSSGKLKDAAKAFVEWLENAEEESSD